MMMIGLNPTALIIVCVLLSIPVSANANIIGVQALEEQFNKAKELVERAINATGLDYQHTGLDQQSKEYAKSILLL
jgi:hypothetical protein